MKPQELLDAKAKGAELFLALEDVLFSNDDSHYAHCKARDLSFELSRILQSIVEHDLLEAGK